MPESADQLRSVADVYASALFSLAQEQGVVDQVRSELEEMAAAQDRDPAFAVFLASAALDEERRRASLEKMFRGKLTDLVLDTVQVMNRHGRAALLPHVLRAYVFRQEEAANQVEVRAVTAAELDAAQRDAIAAMAAAVSGRKPVMEFVVDAEIIGGLMLEVGGVRYDDSVRSRIRALRSRLAERGERGLAVKVSA